MVNENSQQERLAVYIDGSTCTTAYTTVVTVQICS